MSRNVDMRRSMLTELLEGLPAKNKQKGRPSAPVSTLMLDGQRAFDERRWQDAVQHFSHAIENLRDRMADLLHIYDLRSTSYIKLNQMENALKDAKQMIRLDRADARGYLSCARVEQLSGDLAAAAKVCEYGLKSVPTIDRGHSRLEECLIRIKQSAKKSIVFEKGTDPMEVLPAELLDMVIASFDYRQVIALMRVSKRWCSRLRSLDLVTQTIDTRQSRKTITYEQLKAGFARLGKAPKSIALARLNENAARLASSELSHWIRWQSLETLVVNEGKINMGKFCFEKCRNLKSIAVGPGVVFGAKIAELLGKCHGLQHADLRCILDAIRGFPSTCSMWTVNHTLRSLSICPTAQHDLQTTVSYPRSRKE